MEDGLTELSGICSLNLGGGRSYYYNYQNGQKGMSQVCLPDREGGRGNEGVLN